MHLYRMYSFSWTLLMLTLIYDNNVLLIVIILACCQSVCVTRNAFALLDTLLLITACFLYIAIHLNINAMTRAICIIDISILSFVVTIMHNAFVIFVCDIYFARYAWNTSWFTHINVVIVTNFMLTCTCELICENSVFCLFILLTWCRCQTFAILLFAYRNYLLCC